MVGLTFNIKYENVTIVVGRRWMQRRTGEVEDHVGDDCDPEGNVGTGELREAGKGYRDYEQDVDDLRRAEDVSNQR
jgi:hypothetical protein